MTLLTVMLAAACAALLTPARVPSVQRLRDLGLGARPRAGRTAGAPRTPRLPRGPVAVLTGVAFLVVLPLPWSLVPAIGAAVVVGLVSPRLEPAAVRRERAAVARCLPLVCDLLASAWAGGLPADRAVDAVAAATGGPAGRRLAETAVRLRLGQPAAAAWHRLEADAPDLVRVMTQAQLRGTAPVDALHRIAATRRAARRRRGEAAARSAAVRVVGPLGLCFLPAFVVVGIVPVVIGGLRPMLG